MIKRLLKEFEMKETRSISTPIEVNLNGPEDELIIENKSYRRLFCSLLYISITTRPDICQRNTGLVTTCDSDWGGERQSRKSVRGFVAFYNKNPINWFSRKQNCVAISSMEYIAAALAAQEIVNLKGLLSDFDIYDKVILKNDNLSAIATVFKIQKEENTLTLNIIL
ncbi:uncharacterized protein LOC130895766 [Diorhabda carinulata]|uniref:uncharacterized protein LOC130895766 n=1 Tax=Diorhabda carinulata TaxID=1163345 RepID=UPI0025A30C7D|nr:uncharacterized protein LOC130895766 [Diorhabda carinulata]